MNIAKSKVDWCLEKAQKELKKRDKHRGLVKIVPDLNKAREHIKKAEHYLKATDYLKNGDFSDISASTAFYSMYHCLLAIAAKLGYESRNQECTISLINSLIKDGKIELKKELLDKIANLNIEEANEKTSIEIRENYQYGTSLSLNDDIYNELINLAKEIISLAKEEMEK